MDNGGGDANGGNVLGDSDAEGPSWRAEANLQLRVGKNTGEEGYAYNRAKNMKQRTGIVKEAMKATMTKEAQKRALELVQNGQLWDRPPEIIGKQQSIPLQESWKNFHRLSQFNWVLCGGMLPEQYRPKCRCGRAMKKNGRANPPRLVYGSTENYILNAPERFMCGDCAHSAKIQKENGLPQKERVQWSYLSTDVIILDQLRVEHLDIYLMFPCMLTKRAGIDNALLDDIMDEAAKGNGPGGMADTLQRKHCKRWQEKEAKWLAFLKRRKLSPAPCDPLDFSDVEKCPHYLSSGIGGIVPSGSWLVHVFCSKILKLRGYFDAEIVKRVATSEYFSLDASYKVPNWIMRWGGSKLFDCLESGLNDYAEIIMQHFASSDNHEQLSVVLCMLKDAGLKPDLVLTDVPERDRPLMEKIWPSLAAGLEGRDTNADADDESLPTLPVTGDETSVTTSQDAITAIELIDDDLTAEIDNEKMVVSLDFEWPIWEGGRLQGKISTAMIGVNLTSTRTRLVIPFGRWPDGSKRMFLTRLDRFFSRKDVVFIGRMIKNDVSKLKRDYPGYDFAASNLIDVGRMAIHRGVAELKRGQTTLQALVKKAGYYLPKPDAIRCGDVFDLGATLSQEAVTYCVRDVEAPLFLYERYASLPNLALRMKPADVNVGQVVDVMPSKTSSVAPLARGHVLLSSGQTRNGGLTLSATRFLIRVTEVFEEGALAHFPVADNGTRCKCGRNEHGQLREICDFPSLASFGAVPFNMIETASRLRKVEGEVAAISGGGADTTNDMNGQLDGDAGIGADAEDREVDDDEEDNVAEDPLEKEDEEEASIGGDSAIDDNFDLPEEAMEVLDNELQDGEDRGDGDEVHVASPELDFDDNDEASGLGSGDAAAATATCTAVGLVDALADQILKIIQDADLFAEANRETILNEQSMEQTDTGEDDERREKRQKMTPKLISRVLGDAFHLMDRMKVPMHHDFKAAYFQALRAAVFIMDAGDVERVKDVMKSNGRKWSQAMAFNFRYIAERVRRTIPPPTVLYSRLKFVFDFFQDQKDTKTGSPLFNEKARKKADLVLKAVLRGEYSDPPDNICGLYCRKKDGYGRDKSDRNGLALFRSLRGTSVLESLHQKLTKAFGHTMAGALYSDCLLALVRHRHNWRASERNRPDFPQVRHYEGLLIDAVNELYDVIFGYPKYHNWDSADNYMIRLSPFGIVPLDKEGPDSEYIEPVAGLTKSLHYLAIRQRSNIPYTPVKTPEEKKLFNRLVSQLLQEKRSMAAKATFSILEERWNQIAKGSNNIFCKYSQHLTQYYKLWRKTKTRREAVESTDASLVQQALEHVPKLLRSDKLSKQSKPLTSKPTTIPIVTHNNDACDLPEDQPDVPQVQDLPQAPPQLPPLAIQYPPQYRPYPPHQMPYLYPHPHMAAPPRKPQRRPRNCKAEGCPNPSECPGRHRRSQCIVNNNT